MAPSRILVSTSLLTLLAACQGPFDQNGQNGQNRAPSEAPAADAIPIAEDGVTLLLSSRESLQAMITGLESQDFVTAPLGGFDQSFNRVGLRFDASITPTVEVAASPDGIGFGPFAPVRVTYQDGIAHNALADVPAGTHFVRLRFSAFSEEELSFLFVEVFSVDPSIQGDPGFSAAPETGFGRLRFGLAADGVAVLRSTWGSRATLCSSGHTPVRMAIHHTVTPNNDSYDMPRRVRQIQAYHMDSRGWCDVGYHFLIGQDGEVYQARREDLIGAHVAGHNVGTTGISFIGDFTSIMPGQPMLEAGARIIRSLSATYGISIDRTAIQGHREFAGASTACPGDTFFPNLDALVALAASGVNEPANGTLRGAVFWGNDFATAINDPTHRLTAATVVLSNGDTTNTGPDGWYAFDVPAGSYTATVSAAGYLSGTFTREVVAGTTAWGSVMLAPEVVATGTVRGVVVWGKTMADFAVNVGDPTRRVAGATITFSPGGATATTDATGWYEIVLPEGIYTLVASAPGYHDGVRPDPVTVSADTLSWGSTMVLDPQGIAATDQAAPVISIASPAQGAVLDLPELFVVGSVSDASPLAYLRADGVDIPFGAGTFRHTVALSPGKQQIVFEAADTLGNEASLTLEVTYVGAEAAGIRGFIHDGAIGPQARIADAVLDLRGPVVDEVQSDAAGAFDLDLPPGNYQLSVRASGYAPHETGFSVTAGARTSLTIALQEAGGSASPIRITFPQEGQSLLARRVLLSGTLDPARVSRVRVSGKEATIVGEDFSVELRLARGANLLVAVGYDARGAEVARAERTVFRQDGALGCESAKSPRPLLAFGLLILLLAGGLRRPRAAGWRSPPCG